jgi:hypothetical protein
VASAFESKAVGAALPAGGRQFWNDIFQSYGLMAMRSEQHGNVFAKLNNGNLSDCADADENQPAKLTRSLAGWHSMPMLRSLQTIGAAASWLSSD